jgi:hypothetical protein
MLGVRSPSGLVSPPPRSLHRLPGPHLAPQAQRCWRPSSRTPATARWPRPGRSSTRGSCAWWSPQARLSAPSCCRASQPRPWRTACWSTCRAGVSTQHRRAGAGSQLRGAQAAAGAAPAPVPCRGAPAAAAPAAGPPRSCWYTSPPPTPTPNPPSLPPPPLILPSNTHPFTPHHPPLPLPAPPCPPSRRPRPRVHARRGAQQAGAEAGRSGQLRRLAVLGAGAVPDGCGVRLGAGLEAGPAVAACRCAALRCRPRRGLVAGLCCDGPVARRRPAAVTASGMPALRRPPGRLCCCRRGLDLPPRRSPPLRCTARAAAVCSPGLRPDPAPAAQARCCTAWRATTPSARWGAPRSRWRRSRAASTATKRSSWAPPRTGGLLRQVFASHVPAQTKHK